MHLQFRYYVIIKIVLDLSDMLMECCFESTNNEELNFEDRIKYPFSNEATYEYSSDLFKYGMYVKLFRVWKTKTVVQHYDMSSHSYKER